jgi:hypothetical protein
MISWKSKPTQQPHVVSGVDAWSESLKSSVDSYNGNNPQDDNNKPRGASSSILFRSEIPNSATILGMVQDSIPMQLLDRSNERFRLYVSFGPSGGVTRALLSFEIGHIHSDRQLFQFLQAAYRSGSVWSRLFSGFSIREVQFALVRLSRLILK